MKKENGDHVSACFFLTCFSIAVAANKMSMHDLLLDCENLPAEKLRAKAAKYQCL